MNYCIYGSESVLVKKKMNEVISQYIEDQSDLFISSYDASLNDFKLQDVLDDCFTIPFFTRYKVVEIKNALFLTPSSSLSDEDQKKLIDYLNKPSTDTIFILSGQFEKLDSRKKLVKSITKLVRTHQCNKMQDEEFHAFVINALRVNNINLTNEAKTELFQRLRPDLQMFKQILNQFIHYPLELNVEAIKRLVSKPLDDNVFNLTDAVTQKDLKHALHIYRDLQVLNVDPIGLVALIGAQFRLLYQVKVNLSQGKNESEIASLLKVHPYRVKLAHNSCNRITLGYLSFCINECAKLDQDLKMGKIEKNLGFELFLIRIVKG